MRWLVAFVLLALSGLLGGCEPATMVIANDEGGIIVRYITKYVVWAERGYNVRIEGECDSACTIILGIVDNSKICATRNAEFGFHSASQGTEYTEAGTRLLWSFYEERTQRVLARHGWKAPSKHPDLIMIDAQEIVRPCSGETTDPKPKRKV